jgi:hypothetical protein
MPTLNSSNQADLLKSLSDASVAADNAYITAAMNNATSEQLTDLKSARDHASLAYLSAMKESLVNNGPFTQKIKQELDAATIDINNKLATLKDVTAWMQLLDNIAKLAGTLASAFA